MKKILLLLTYLIAGQLIAQQSYYNDVDLWLTGLALRDELATKITNTHTHTLNYTDAREALKIVDLDPGQNTYVLLVYGFAPEVCPANPGNDNDHRRRNKSDFGGSADCEWNREHTYPKSLGTPELGTSGPGADAHMLRAADVQRNSERGSKKFRDGSGNSHTVNSDYWYPGDEWKGDMARMMMYMYLRYGDQCLPSNVGFGTTNTVDPNMINLFLEWNAEDPVSDYEVNRNNYLANAGNTYGQGNRNPFIDDPYLATRIWGGTPAEDIWGIYLAVDENSLDNALTLYPLPAQKVLYIKGIDNTFIKNMQILALTGKVVKEYKSIPNNTLSIEQLKEGIYIVKIQTLQGLISRKLVVNKS